MTDVHFINVGYGDAALILCREAGIQTFSMLVDCGGATTGGDGPTGSRVTAAEYLKALGVDALDVVLLSHLHLDHAGGLLAVAESCAVKELWTNYAPSDGSQPSDAPTDGALPSGVKNLLTCLDIYAKALRVLRTKGTAIRVATESFSIIAAGCRLHVIPGGLAPALRQTRILDTLFTSDIHVPLLDELDRFINDTSLCAELTVEGKYFYFTGDLCADLLEKSVTAPADVLKVPHHGHSDGLSDAAVRKLRPKYAVISVSNTRTDFCPHPHVIRTLAGVGARVLFTDAVGAMPGQYGDRHRAVIFSVERGKLSLGYS